MKWTGERMIAEHNMGKGEIEHLHRYGIIVPYIKGKVVLDLASGEGYGSNLIAQNAFHVTGVDISADAVKHASQKYNRSNLRFLEGSATKVPLDDHSVDVIVSFETLEHHDKHDEMIVEFKRVLRPEGILFISSPEKENYHKIDPFNPYHIKELTFEEFDELLKKYFVNTHMYRQRFFDVSFIYPFKKEITGFEEYTGDFRQINQENFDANYYFNIAICTNSSSLAINISASFFNGTEHLKFREEEIIRHLEARITSAVEEVQQSYSFKLGSFLLLPFSTLKRLLKK
jgi:ubiquinone/menaquinone biosynthesis C-methylase UbiE